MFDIITNSMLFLLESLKAIVGNYGWAIIVLTILVRLALWPVSKSQMKSMKMMQELQPKMKMLQERHKADPQRLQTEMMKLYKDYKFNPLGGCLPMLVQLPLFIGLYWAISNPVFMTTGDPTFLNVIHLNHTGVMSHAGPSSDGVMNLSENAQGGLFGFGKDTVIAGAKMTVYLKDGTTLEDKPVPKPNEVLTIRPKQLMGGIPLKISTTYDKLGLDSSEDLLKSVSMTVVNNGTKEIEKITLTPQPNTTVLRTELKTAVGKTVPHFDVLVLVVIFAATMLLSQRLMTSQAATTGSEQQQQMMKLMPIMFSVMLFLFPIPAGVLLYMDTNSLFQIFQTWMFQRESKPGKSNPPSQTILDIKPDTPKRVSE